MNMNNYDYYFRRSTSCGQLLALRVGPAAPHPARLSVRLSSHIIVWSSLHCVARMSTNVKNCKQRKMNSRKVILSKRRCVVPGCASSRHAKHHQFPKDVKQGLLWLEAVLNPLLKNLTYEEIDKSGYRVCCLHFREQDYLCGPRNVFKKKILPSVLLFLI